MNGLIKAAGGAIKSGRFISTWSIVIALLVSLTVMAPAVNGVPLALLHPAGLVGSLCFVVLLATVAVLERQILRPGRRAVVVIVGVLVAAAGRPILQDAWLLAFGATPAPGWQLPFRIATNVIVWAVALVTIAVIVDAARSLRGTNSLLRSAIHELDATRDRADAFDGEARAALRDAVVSLRDDIEAFRLGRLTASAIASERIRSWSHNLGRLANQREDHNDASSSSEGDLGPRPQRGLRLPPIGVITLLYAVCFLPYATRVVPLPQLLVSVVVLVAGGAIVDLLPRLRAARGARRSSAVFLALAVVVGLTLSLAAALGGAEGWLAGVPALVYVALAVASAMCTGTLHALRVERRRLSDAVSAQQRASHLGARPARDALLEAAELLHRDGQGDCTSFAIEHPKPTSAERAVLAKQLGDLLDRVGQAFDRARSSVDSTSIEALIATWGRVMELEAQLSPAAITALDTHPGLARDAYDVVAEGLLNAVKHGGAGAAWVELGVIASGAGPRLRVQVGSPGTVGVGTQLRSGSHLDDLGARLHPAADGARLEAALPLVEDRMPRPVVSAEHPRRERAPRA
jgi:hypothetical protein